ncbi:MAG: hypothetical protein Ct9H300mP3_03870 [Gammaproteobacteria bacterium]|nr:MAG: hypothetical protein Ct9H300mP3_03870 [Gammaproteobacteria bacterium]
MEKKPEGAASNVFAVFDNQVIPTPNQIKYFLDNQKHVISFLITKELKYGKKVLKLEDIYKAEEVWVTSSTQEIQPVKKIDGKS